MGENDSPSCRICYEESEIDNLISPCRCRGSLKWVHPKCLNEWVKVSKKWKCQHCLVNYQTQKSYSSKLGKIFMETNGLTEIVVGILILLTVIVIIKIFILL